MGCEIIDGMNGGTLGVVHSAGVFGLSEVMMFRGREGVCGRDIDNTHYHFFRQ
jgi:hypothetical protein